MRKKGVFIRSLKKIEDFAYCPREKKKAKGRMVYHSNFELDWREGKVTNPGF